MSENIYKIVADYENDFLKKPVKIVEGYDFNQLETIKNNQRLYAGKFKSGNVDEFGYKYFYNIGKSRVKNAAKNIDLDTKDINIRASLPKYYYKAWLMRRDIRQWMKARKLGKVFNIMAVQTPKYGSFVLKKVGGEEIVREVNLKNIKCDPTALSLKLSGWLIEDHFYTPYELKQEVEKRGWDKDQVEKAVANYRKFKRENYVDENIDTGVTQGSAQYIHVKEFSGEVPECVYEEGGSEDKFVLVNFILVSPENVSAPVTTKEAERKGLILHKKEIKEIDYKEVHYDREEGRWLGVGIIEDLADAQKLKNEEINQVVLALRLANLIIYQTGDETIARNVLTDLVNGDILKAKATLSRIDTRNYGIGDSNTISQEIQTLANDLSNSFEVTTGASLPSGTPFALGTLINQNANKLFDFIRENCGLFWEEVFEDWIIPELEKDLSKEHILELTDEREIRWVMDRMKSNTILEAIKGFIIENRRKPTDIEVQVAMQVLNERMKAGENIYLEMPKDFYDFEKSVVTDVTGESLDKQATLQSLATIMQMIGGNPAMLDHPAVQKIMDIAGFDSVDFQSDAQPQAAPEQVMQPV